MAPQGEKELRPEPPAFSQPLSSSATAPAEAGEVQAKGSCMALVCMLWVL